MDKEQLILALSQPMQFQMVMNSIRILESNEVDIKELFEICFHKKK